MLHMSNSSLFLISARPFFTTVDSTIVKMPLIMNYNIYCLKIKLLVYKMLSCFKERMTL